jgi:hypothetical protein
MREVRNPIMSKGLLAFADWCHDHCLGQNAFTFKVSRGLLAKLDHAVAVGLSCNDKAAPHPSTAALGHYNRPTRWALAA